MIPSLSLISPRSSQRFSASGAWFGVLLALLIVAEVSAHDHRPPDARLRIGDHRQLGETGTVEWARGGEAGCSHMNADAAWSFPEGIHVEPGKSSARVVFLKEQEPKAVRIRSWNSVNDREEPEGRGREVSYQLLPSKRAPQTWRADFHVRVRDHLYLLVVGVWKDVDGCGGTQSIDWTFHLAAQ